MGEAKRRKHAKSQWDDLKQRQALIATIHHGLAQDTDPSLTGVTVIFPSGETRFLSAADAKKPPTADA